MARFRIDPDRSKVWINASSSLHPIHSETNGLEGWLDLAFDDHGHIDLGVSPSAHLELPVSRLRSGNPLEERELKRRIDARRYPTITGDLTSMQPASADGRYRVAGEVTFRGVTQPHEDEMTVSSDGNGTLRLEGESTFDVRDYGMEPPRILMLRVHPDVKVRVEVVAVRDS